MAKGGRGRSSSRGSSHGGFLSIKSPGSSSLPESSALSASSSPSLPAKIPSTQSLPEGAGFNSEYKGSGYYPSLWPFYSSHHYSNSRSDDIQPSNNLSSSQFYQSNNNSSNISSTNIGYSINDTNGYYRITSTSDRSVGVSNNLKENNTNISFFANMHMTDQQRLDQARTLAWTLDKLSRSPKRVSPSAPLIIPVLMITVTLFALICIVIKLFMNYLKSKNKTSQKFGPGVACSPDLPTTPELDQTSLATTASMKTRGSLRQSSKNRRNKLPPVSLYQIKQKQSPKTSTSTKLKGKGAMRALAKASKSDPNRSLSRDTTRQDDDNSDLNINNDGSDSPTNLSQRSFDTDEIQAANQTSVVYAAAPSNAHHDDTDGPHQSTSHQPEVHIVQIRDLEDNVQHSQYPQTESEI